MAPKLSMDGPRVGLARWRAENEMDTRGAVRRLAVALLNEPDEVLLHAPAGERPRLLSVQGCDRGFVSLSHTRKAVAAAVSGQPIGVDVEWLDRRVRWEALARAHFSLVEQGWLWRQPERERKAAFLGLWTLKEAWLKAQGLGVWRLAGACFTPRDSGSWAAPGDGWRGECRYLDSALVVSAVWRGDKRLDWLESQPGGDWTPLIYHRRWRAWS